MKAGNKRNYRHTQSLAFVITTALVVLILLYALVSSIISYVIFSNLYQNAYAEFLFPTVLWPDFTVHDYDEALEAYGHRDRRFGRRDDDRQ